MFKSLDAISSNINKTNRNVVRFLDTFLKPYNITPEQWTVLNQLDHHGSMTQKELSELTEKDQATLTRILDLLAKKGLVRRITNELDRRSFILHVTDEGNSLVEDLYPKIEQQFREIIFKDITDNQLEDLNNILTQIKTNLMKRGMKIDK